MIFMFFFYSIQDFIIRAYNNNGFRGSRFTLLCTPKSWNMDGRLIVLVFLLSLVWRLALHDGLKIFQCLLQIARLVGSKAQPTFSTTWFGCYR